MLKIAVLVSGGGTNLQALLDAGLPYAAVLIIRALAMNMLKNDFHFFNLILIPLLHVL